MKVKTQLNNYRIKRIVLVSIKHCRKSHTSIIAILRKAQVSTDVMNHNYEPDL